MLADPTGQRWYDMLQKGGQDAVQVALEVIDRFSKGTFPKALAGGLGLGHGCLNGVAMRQVGAGALGLLGIMAACVAAL